MGLTYFRRYRMELKLNEYSVDVLADSYEAMGYELVGYDDDLIREHAQAKFQSFRNEMDSNVFPCLGRRDGCLRLMREITARATFVPGATWLIRFRERPGGRPLPVATVQGIEQDRWGSIQNLGVIPEHRGRGLARFLMHRAAIGFRAAGLMKMNLEVTTSNTPAVALYERIGFRRAKVVYKACEVAGV